MIFPNIWENKKCSKPPTSKWMAYQSIQIGKRSAGDVDVKKSRAHFRPVTFAVLGHDGNGFHFPTGKTATALCTAGPLCATDLSRFLCRWANGYSFGSFCAEDLWYYRRQIIKMASDRPALGLLSVMLLSTKAHQSLLPIGATSGLKTGDLFTCVGWKQFPPQCEQLGRQPELKLAVASNKQILFISLDLWTHHQWSVKRPSQNKHIRPARSSTDVWPASIRQKRPDFMGKDGGFPMVPIPGSPGWARGTEKRWPLTVRTSIFWHREVGTWRRYWYR